MLLEDKMSSTESFDGYVRGKLAWFKAVVDYGHQLTDLPLRTAMVICLPKEMEACKESLQTNILGKSKSEIIELFRAAAAGKRFNDLVLKSAAPTAKMVAQAPDAVKSPASSRPSTPSRRQQQPSQGSKSGGGKPGRDSSGWRVWLVQTRSGEKPCQPPGAVEEAHYCKGYARLRHT
jgi:hypothetical protein